MAYRFKPSDYVIRINSKLKHRILKLALHIKRTRSYPLNVNERVYEYVSAKGTTYYFSDEELQPLK
jgi:hypothetical protein